MAASKMFEFMFSLAGKMDASFRNSFKGANDIAGRTKQELGSLNQTQKQLEQSFKAGAISQQSYANAMEKTAIQAKKLNDSQSRLNAAQNMKSEAKTGREKYGKVMMTGAAMAAPFVYAGKVAADFEFMMSRVQAITVANQDELATMTKTARQLGATTRYTATQAAEAMTFLGMAGWKTNQIVAAMPGMLDLAAAGNVDLARTADIVSDTMTAFGIEAKDATHVADVFAVTITNTNTDVEKLGDTMKYAAPVAKAFGASLEETSAIAGMMANSGIKASQAGTALRAGMLRLAGPPKKASKAMAELGMSMDNINTEQREAAAALAAYGIDMDDATGAPRKMSAILKELQPKIMQLSENERIAAASAIFGTNASAGWLAVLDQGPEAFDNLVTSLEQSDGAAKKMAKTMNDNAKGAMIQLMSAMESVSIDIGNVFLPQFAETALAAATVASGMSEWSQANPELTKTIVGAGAAVAALVIGVGLLGWTYNFLKGGIATVIIDLIKFQKWMFITQNTTTGLTKAQVLSAKTQAIYGTSIKWLGNMWSFSAIKMKAAVAAQWLLNAAMAANPIGLVIGGIVALIAIGYVLYNHWDKVKTFFTAIWESPVAAALAFATGPIGMLIYLASGVIAQWGDVKAWFVTLWNDPSKAVEQFTTFIQSKFAGVFNWLSDKWNWVKSLFGSPVDMKVNASATNTATGQQVAANALGGIYGKGAFLTTFAEASGESAIPHDKSQRSISLWEKTGEILGVRGRGSSSPIVYSPKINIAGNADSQAVAQIEQALQASKAEFERWWEEKQRQNRRVSYA